MCGVEYLVHDGWRDLLPDILHVINSCFQNGSCIILSPFDIRQQRTQLLTAILDSLSDQKIKDTWVSSSSLNMKTNKPPPGFDGKEVAPFSSTLIFRKRPCPNRPASLTSSGIKASGSAQELFPRYHQAWSPYSHSRTKPLQQHRRPRHLDMA